MAFSTDGRRLAVGGDAGTVKVWDLTGPTPQEAAELKAADGVIGFVSFLPGGDTLVARGVNELRVWRAPSFAEIEADDKGRGNRSN